MHLTPEQREQFDRDGYLFFPGLFTPEETQTLLDAVPELYSRREAYNVREKGSDAVRTNFAAHLVQRALRAAGAPSAHGGAGGGPVRRRGLHAPVQDQRQDGLRRRRLAVAPGLRHLAQRRP